MAHQLFDAWPERYNQWFETPIGALVREYEQRLILDLLRPQANERILDAGCGTGIFTQSVAASGSDVIGLDLSAAMLRHARRTLAAVRFQAVVADMLTLPFRDAGFDKVVSVTALEFIQDAGAAVDELMRVTRARGWVVIATLNSLSPWARRRQDEARANDQSVFRHAYFRSPDQLRALVPIAGTIKTAIHFADDADPVQAAKIEEDGQRAGLDTGAFVIGCWRKP